MKAVSYADIDPQEPEWGIEGYLPYGLGCYIAGEGGTGKSFVMADWAARVTRGDKMPGDSQEAMPPGSVILITKEDDPHMSMAYRLRAAGADLSRVFDMTDGFQLPRGLDTLREEIRTIGDVRLVVIDPLAAVSSIPITSGNTRIRAHLSEPIESFARETGVMLPIVHHRTKSGRTAGAKAITDAARQVLSVTRLAPGNPIRLIQVEKSNIASDSSGVIAYTLAGTGLDTHVEYCEAPEDGTEAPKREPSTLDKLLAVLRKDGPLATQELCRRASVDYGAGRTALTRGKESGAVISPRRGVWSLPEAPTEAPASERKLSRVK